jgi:hypothetical protein
VEKLYWGLMHALLPLIFLAVPGTAVSVVCGALGIARRSRALLLTAASCSVPMLLYVLMGEAWWRALVPAILALYFAAAFAVPTHRVLAAVLVVPYFAFVGMLANALWF